MSTPTPERLKALERANEVRLARVALKRKIERGEVFAASVILDPPEEATTWQVADVLMAQRRWGTERMRRFLGRLEISERAELGPPVGRCGHRGLTDRQRRLLARALGQDGER